jgi:aryl-alcohol dehydrogenase-like predicted oxidoreductase
VETRALGGSDLRVSVLGLGCWPLGGGDGWGQVDEDQAVATIHAALDAGITFFDTAEAYNDGRSEEIVGKALADRRDRALIATKVSPKNTTPDALRRSLDASLKRLRTDYVDLYQVHWPMPDENVDAAIEVLEGMVASGAVRTLGVSNHGVQQMDRVVWTGAPIAANQLCYNLLTRAIECEVAPACRKYGISIIAYMALMQGLLAGAYRSADDVPTFRARTRHFAASRGARHGEEGYEELTFCTIDAVRAIAADLGMPMATLSLAWVMAQPGVATVLVGSRKPDQLARNLEAAEVVLSDETLRALDEASRPLRDAMGDNIDLWQGGERRRSF